MTSSTSHLFTYNSKGAPALTSLGVAAHQLARGERGGALVALSSRLIGKRHAQSNQAIPHAELVALMEEVVNEGAHLGQAALQDQLADLVVLAFEASDVREGRGERDLFVQFMTALYLAVPETVLTLLSTVPHYSCWRNLALLYEAAVVDQADNHRDAARVAHFARLREQIAHLWAKQLIIDNALVEAQAAYTAEHGKAPKARLSLAGKWAPRIEGSYDKRCGLARHIAAVMALMRANGSAGVIVQRTTDQYKSRADRARASRAAADATSSDASATSATPAPSGAGAGAAAATSAASSAADADDDMELDMNDVATALEDVAGTRSGSGAAAVATSTASRAPTFAELEPYLTLPKPETFRKYASELSTRVTTYQAAAAAAKTHGGGRRAARRPIPEIAEITTSTTTPFAAKSAAIRAQEAAYRGVLSKLNTALDVVEVKMCGKRWAEITPEHVPSLANKKYKAAIQNRRPPHVFKRDPEHDRGHRGGLQIAAAVRSTDPDRVTCAESVKAAAEASLKSKTAKRIKGARNQAHELVNIYLLQDVQRGFFIAGEDGAPAEAADPLVEAMWHDLVQGMKDKGTFKPGLPLVDVSGSMDGIPMQVAIALGILMAQLQPKTSLWHGRMLTFESEPHWHNISECETLYSAVSSVKQMPWGGSTNFASALHQILQLAIAARLPAEEMPKVLYVFSDMNFDQASEIRDRAQVDPSDPMAPHFKLAGHDIRAAFRDAGYEAPLLVMWNLRAGGNPTYQADSSTPGVAMMSGFSQECLRQFCEEGALATTGPSAAGAGVEAVNPWTVLSAKLLNERYDRIRRVCAQRLDPLFEGYTFVPPDRTKPDEKTETGDADAATTSTSAPSSGGGSGGATGSSMS